MWLEILGTLIGGIVLFLFAVVKFLGGNKEYWEKRGVPSLTVKERGTFFGRRNLPFHEIDALSYKAFRAKSNNIAYGGIVEFRKPMALIIDPELIKHILVKDFDHFINRRGINTKQMDPYFDNMLFNMEGQTWKEMRATMSPTFSTGKIKRMFDIFEGSAQKFVKYLEESCGQNSAVELDMRDPCGRLTLDVIASSAFGVDTGNFADKNTAFTQMSTRFNKSNQFNIFMIFKFLAVVMLPKFIMKPFGFTFFDKISMDFFADVVKTSIRQREILDSEKREDFLQLMLDAKNGRLDDVADDQTEIKKAKLTDDLILAQCVLFFIAGFDTTESLLIFASYELALNPEVQEKLFEEVDETLEKNSGELTYDLVNRMSYLDMVISETLRKYPPAVRLDRRVNQTYKVPGSDLIWEKDTIAIIPVYSIHYDETNFPDPKKFIPERFTHENKAARHPYTYMPFGLGPRSCIAMRFALVEAKTTIAHLVHSFKLEPSAKTPIPVTYSRSSSLKPANGLWLNVKRRINNEWNTTT